ncbi:MAG: hypothetical protein DHS20C14_20320 [Phycisphaeraceae bacterium]|nr:MAG: hypothetical protein DHS20C14_20320 [Phycisphaeraceae bacterium]
MPLLAMVAVMLSVATVLVTWSIMGGFLKVLLESGRPMVGDAVIHWPIAGFAHYDDLIERLEANDRIEAAAPMTESLGLVRLPTGQIRVVTIKGVEPDAFRRVTGFEDTIWWRPLNTPTRKDHDRDDPRLGDHPSMQFYYDNALTMTRPDPTTGDSDPAAIIGIELSGLLERTAAGIYVPQTTLRARPDGEIAVESIFMPRNGEIGLTLLALDHEGIPIDSISRRLPVANEFQSGVYEVDSGTVLVPLDWLQRQLRMDEAVKVNTKGDDIFGNYEQGPDGVLRPKPLEATGVAPARVTTVLVRGVDDATPDEIKKIIEEEVYPGFAQAHEGVPHELDILVLTWADQNATLIASVRKETGLVLFIFGIVCFTTVFLVLAIFWSMISEKTKDIGILRALGATTAGVAWLWLRYSGAIGVVGSALGLVAGYLIVTNINAIHEWLGETFGLVVWDARVYYFVEIPREMEWHKALIVGIAGVVTCLFGAALPAWRAARMRPVQALRFE